MGHMYYNKWAFISELSYISSIKLNLYLKQSVENISYRMVWSKYLCEGIRFQSNAP